MTNTITVYRKKRNYNTNLVKEGIVRVGFFPDSRYDGAKSVAQVARYNEFGLGVPARPFMRPAVHTRKQELTDLLHRTYRQALRDNQDTLGTLEKFGEFVKGLIQEQIVNTTTPPNAPSTIKKKGVNAPLRDTLIMLHSVRFQAEEYKK